MNSTSETSPTGAALIFREAPPMVGSLIMYAGPAFYGEDFADHGPIGGCFLRVNEYTPDGCFVTVEDARSQDGDGAEAFLAFKDDFAGRYFLKEVAS